MDIHHIHYIHTQLYRAEVEKLRFLEIVGVSPYRRESLKGPFIYSDIKTAGTSYRQKKWEKFMKSQDKGFSFLGRLSHRTYTLNT